MDENIKAYGICLYKKVNKSYEILLCKSVKSKGKWGFLKGVSHLGESKEETAIREFIEESNIAVSSTKLENYYFQKNETKNIGIFLYNAKNVKNLESYFINSDLYESNLSWENSKVSFFDIRSLPEFKKKQNIILEKIVQVLKSKS